MDQSVKRMLKLIEEDGDSFAKKAGMYYQKRPELISHVEEFYRMYRFLAERYDHVTGELRKNIPSDLQSQGSGISDISTELPSPCPSPEPKPSRPRSGPRAAGLDVFLGSSGSSTDLYHKEGGDSSSLTDSESESDNSSVNNYSSLVGNGGDQGLQPKVMELETELREVKEKLRLQQEANADGSAKDPKIVKSEELLARIANYKEELKHANEQIKLSGEEISRLKIELEKYLSSEISNYLQAESGSLAETSIKTRYAELDLEKCQVSKLQEAEALDADTKIQALLDELRTTKEKLQGSEKEIATLKHELETIRSEKIQNLQKQLELSQKDVITWKAKLNSEKREVSKLQERIARLKTSLSDRDHEIRDLKIAVSDAEQKIFPEKAHIKAEIAGLLDEKVCLQEQLREWESRGRRLDDEIRKIKAEKTEMEQRLYDEIKELKSEIAVREDRINELNGHIDALNSKRDELNSEINKLKADMSCKDGKISEMEKHLEELHMEHVKLNAGVEEGRKVVRGLRERGKEMEKEMERQRVMIMEGAEEKREAIRQLCFSLEHYRNGYLRLRKAFIGNKGVAVLV
ncbi:hypothetical protein Pint_30666 [Pistacia integerrima]|uniref:Uncharacterized protein n=1 Tax=Pistacia integerrima TaxID=434235 RepID=A0ACC0X295_9ROSI|nr:hypothetical protein Pint_30666 [Pistacia integerrima]